MTPETASLTMPLAFRQQVRLPRKRTTSIVLAHIAIEFRVPMARVTDAFSIEGGEAHGCYVLHEGRLHRALDVDAIDPGHPLGTERVHEGGVGEAITLDDDLDVRLEAVQGLLLRDGLQVGGQVFLACGMPSWKIAVDAARPAVAIEIAPPRLASPSSTWFPLAQGEAALAFGRRVASELMVDAPVDILSTAAFAVGPDSLPSSDDGIEREGRALAVGCGLAERFGALVDETGVEEALRILAREAPTFGHASALLRYRLAAGA